MIKGVSLKILYERLGRVSGKRQSGSARALIWQCGGRPGCHAVIEAPYVPTPPNLTPIQEELFDNYPLPENGWTLTPCELHMHLFS